MSKIDPFKYYKTSPEIIKLAVMYYVRYPLSLRQVEDILHERGIDICHETVRYWWNKFGHLFAKDLKKKAMHPHSNWRWHIDEVFVKINGQTHYLWRAIDHEGTVLDCFVSKRRNRKVARKVLKKLMSRYGHPKEIVTDKLPSYKAALRDLNLDHLQETGRYKNNQIENSHLHFRRRERGMNKFRLMRSLQKFISIQSTFQNHFNNQRHLENRQSFKNLRQNSINAWKETCA
ncbi:MAG TPA: IS6 family transposase [Alphaproteobacteria bacterium]|nr:IS6 family transposase [Micavibrio sp.]MBK9562922.1 IS6 family transposase [Micavibrio sp.]HQX26702.1 IS6 family transposase [Alphaproteobacteria bacterium]